jgi:hypothetical protein
VLRLTHRQDQQLEESDLHPFQANQQSKELLGLFHSQEKLVLPLHKNQRHDHKKALLTRQRLDAHIQKQAQSFLDVPARTIFSKKRVTNLVPRDELLKIFSRALTVEQN